MYYTPVQYYSRLAYTFVENIVYPDLDLLCFQKWIYLGLVE